jgi:hypothetical protein
MKEEDSDGSAPQQAGEPSLDGSGQGDAEAERQGEPGRHPEREASALWGVSDIAIKYLTQASPGPVLGLVSPCTLTALIAGVIAFYASARSLQIGDGVEVIALTSVTANLTAIIGGILVFHDPIGSGAVGITGRFLAFCLVIAGAALMPAPMRATPDAT